ncbi:MAG: intermembrane transport protein PqiB [Marinobacter sp.]|uniref:intermembrane transport protein PqiB n=1 Tax=Marinobacter sp. TaxID=50741 RepID=UPI00299F35DC|nr:intermembrane transport protein PqiB [Marinobacter sp.]MDX1757494.1 intermembrane transport protein PqiB [Marinobacter sp.]
MNDDPDTSPSRKLSAVWIIPLVAAVIGGWLVYSNLSSRGLTITLKLDDAEGISAGTTAVKARNVQVGVVDSVSLSEDLSHTLLRVQMQADTERMLSQDTRFWVVKPRVGREGISGLTTVVSGVYIELLPGTEGPPRSSYTVSDSLPPEVSGEGLYLQLLSAAGSDIDTGDPVSFRSLRVGRVVETEFDPAQKAFRHRLFIEAPYDVLVTRNCRFWPVSGVGFRWGPQGFEARLGSLESFLGGGVTFAVPDSNMSAGEPARDGDTFILYEDEDAAHRALYSLTLDYVLLIDGSVRGLQAGAPVEYRGVRVGTVEQVAWGFGYEGPGSMGQNPVPVLIRFEPQRLTLQNQVAMAQWRSEISEMIGNGLRASLKPGNLLTGAMFVDLAFYPDVPEVAAIASYRSTPIFPTIRHGGIRKIEEQVGQLLETLNGVPFQDIADRMNQNLDSLARVSQRLDAMLGDPALIRLPREMTDTLAVLREAFRGWEADTDQDGAAYKRLQATLQKMNRLLNDARPLVDTLNERPNALIFQNRASPDPQPRAAQ